MTQLAQPPQADPAAEETVALERKSKVWLWITIGIVLVAAVGFVATTMLGVYRRLLSPRTAGAT